MQSHIENLSSYKTYLGVLSATETFLNTRGFLKLDLPALVPALIPESYLEVFETEYRYLDVRKKMYLTPSPEVMIKRLLINGVGDSYYLGKSYRNSEPESSKHSGEFTMLEMYKVGVDYMGMANVVLALFQHILYSIAKEKHTLTYLGNVIDLSGWEKLSVAEAFSQYAAITPEELFDHDKFLVRAQEKGYSIFQTDTKRPFSYEEVWSQVYATEVEKHLGSHGKPTLLYDYPVEFTPLSKPNADGKTAQRFECYIAGVEIGNCYSELSDWKMQKERLQEEQQERKISGKIRHTPDWGFIEALKTGLPDCAGIAIGVDRLAMIFANVDSIEKLKLITFRQ